MASVGATSMATRVAAGPRRPQPRAVPWGLAVMTDGLAVLSVVCLWVLLQVVFLSGLSHERDQAVLYQRFRAELAAATAPTGGAIAPGDPVALVRLPSLGAELVVVEGTASGDLLAGPGHRRDTVLPGQVGVSLVYGRARTYGGPFAGITSLRPGDEVVTRTAQGRSRFRVMGVRRAGDPLPPPPAAGESRLTLVTGEGSGRLAAVSPGTAVYVDAELVGKAFIPASGRPLAVPDSERAMAVDSSALPLFALTLAALLGVVAAVSWLRQRLSLAVAWVLGAPVVMALAWASTDVAMRLLPNLL